METGDPTALAAQIVSEKRVFSPISDSTKALENLLANLWMGNNNNDANRDQIQILITKHVSNDLCAILKEYNDFGIQLVFILIDDVDFPCVDTYDSIIFWYSSSYQAATNLQIIFDQSVR